jgi:DNA-binding NarL/FixJ family response regulator
MLAERPVRVLLADASPVVLQALTRFLATDPRLLVIGRCVSGGDACWQAAELRPDLVLVDIALRDLNGFEASRRIKSLPEAPRVVIVAFTDGALYRAAADRAGADGFVAKQELGTQLLVLIDSLFGLTPTSSGAQERPGDLSADHGG